MATIAILSDVRSAKLSAALVFLARVLHLLVAVPSILFVVVLGLMLFHPPDFHFHSLDRAGLAILGFVVLLQVCVSRLRIPFWGPVTLPLLGLVILGFGGVLVHPDAETWSLFAAKWFVPFSLFHLSAVAFPNERSRKHLETFALIVLAYLSFIAICFLFGLTDFIYPRCILNEALGYHADRARGPFLQAVANGVALNLLGLVAIDSFRRKKRWLVVLLIAAMPLAIIATKTRAVWLSFAAAMFMLAFSPWRRVRKLCRAMLITGILGLGIVLLWPNDSTGNLIDRLAERSPVDFRMAVYEAGGEMFLQKPLFGWDAAAMQSELARHVTDFHQREFYFHNTYLEILVRHGLLGLGLYAWLVVGLFQLKRKPKTTALQANQFLDGEFRSLWPIFLLVYFVNGFLVVMNYQFVNGFLFSIAGVLAGQNLSVEDHTYGRVELRG